MSNACPSPIPASLAGPYDQTLFLGCSISSFTCNLGWGADQSTLNVTLVEDNCDHPNSSNHNANIDIPINAIVSQTENTPSLAFRGIGDRDPVFNPLADTSKSLYKNIAKNIHQSEIDREVKDNIRRVYGKKILGTFNIERYWPHKDPGFLGILNRISRTVSPDNPQSFDILGTPVVFRFEGFRFGGMVSSWKQNGGSAAVQTFDVEIKSFSSLLNGCQLIIDKYAGTMCGIVPNTSANPIAQNLAVPSAYTVDNTTNPPGLYFYDHNATIKQGNIPNVFNIYGYLEYLGLTRGIYGNAGVTDEGIRAQFVYDALITMLGSSDSLDDPEIQRFAPFGCILTRTIRFDDGRDVSPQDLTYTVFGGNSMNLTDMGICPNALVLGKRRSRLLLDISEVPRPPRWLRIPGPNISIMQFITDMCDGAGFDFFVDFIPPPQGAVYAGIIKIKTISRRTQPKKNQIDAFITRVANLATPAVGVSSYSKGKEYTDTNVRSMYIGGNQRRVVQLRSTRLSFKQNTLIYDPWANNFNGHWIDYGIDINQGAPNTLRTVNPNSTRRYSLRVLGGAAVCSDSQDFHNIVYFGGPSNSRAIKKGNYLDAVNLSDGAAFIEGASPRPEGDAPTPLNVMFGDQTGNNIALYNDTICPFFGVGFGGLIRKVFFDKSMGQLQILFYVGDIQSLSDLPFSSGIPTSPIFLVLENEIRAAGAGFPSWLKYCFGNIFTTDISQLVYKGFRLKYGFSGGSNSRDEFLTGMQLIFGKAYGKSLIVNGRPMQVGLDDLNPHLSALYKDLEKIHAFFADIANKYYGKQYMVRGPDLAYYIDGGFTYDNSGNRIVIDTDESGQQIYATEGSQKIYTNYTIPSDGAWEEPGNWIDDTMMVGGLKISSLTDEAGKIPPLLGFNSSVEKDYKRLWHKIRMLFYGSLGRLSDSPGSQTLLDYEFILQRMMRNSDDYYSSINHSFDDPTSYTEVTYADIAVTFGAGSVTTWPMAHGENVPSNRKYKLYAKADVGKIESSSIEQMPPGFAFLEPGYYKPRIILTLPSPVYIGQKRNPTDHLLDAVMAQDAALLLTKGVKIPTIFQAIATTQAFGTIAGVGISRPRTVLGGFSPSPMGFSGQTNFDYASILMNLLRFHVEPQGMEDTGGGQQDSILQKAAIPMFCALPVESNTLVYGPWINHPGLIMDTIFPHTSDRNADIENLIGGVKVTVDDGLVPWNFGGMTALDDSVMSKIADDVNYQQFIETGTVQIPGFDNQNLGDIIRYAGGNFDGPIMNSIQVQIGDNGIITTYNFRTYNRKLGLFNKENAERIKSIGQESIKRNKEINMKLKSLAQKIGFRYS